MPETGLFDCKQCERSNNAEDMVHCDQCEEWLHYSCAGVDATVQDLATWVCATCRELTARNSVGLTVPTTSSGAAAGNLPAPPGTQVTVAATTAQSQWRAAEPAALLNANLQWLQVEQDKLERQLEEQQRQLEEQQRLELERKRKELREVSSLAMQEMRNAVAAAAAGQPADPGQAWLQQVVTKMRDVSIVQGAKAGRSTSSKPARTSTPVSAGLDLNAINFILPPTPPQVVEGAAGLHAAPLAGVSSAPPAGFLSAPPAGIPFAYSTSAMSQSGQIPKYPLPYPGLYSGNMFGQVTAPGAPAGMAQTQTVSASSSMSATLPQSLYGGGMSVNAGAPWSAPYVPPFGFAVSTSAGYAGVPPSLSAVPQYYPLHGTMPTSGTGVPVSASNPFPGLEGLYGAPLQPPVVRTRDQLIARQVIAKELPIFTGDPCDWPLFYSSYVNSTSACGYSQDENLSRLNKALKGKALAAVKGRLLLPQCVPQVLSTLYQRFGRPEIVLQAFLEKVDEFPTLKSNDFDGLVELGTLAENICDHIVATGLVAHLCNPDLMRRLGSKLPESLLIDWGMCKRQLPDSDLRSFTTYMSRVSEAALEAQIATGRMKSTKASKTERGKEKHYLNAHSESEPSPKQQTPPAFTVVCLACNGANHKVKDCASFRKWDSERRWRTVEDHHLCRTCLGKHGKRPCKSQAKCGVKGCEHRHHQLLHKSESKANTAKKDEAKQDVKTTAPVKSSSDGVNAHHAVEQSTLFRILPVTLHWKGKSVDTFAFLDDGSSMTLMEQMVAKRLGIDDGELVPLCLTWTSNVTRQEPTSQRVAIEIAGVGKRERFALSDTRTVASLNLPKQTLRYEELARRYTHLQGLPVDGYDAASPGILIGSNNAGLIATLRLREGQLGDPVAAKTRLGWSIFGQTPDQERTRNYTFHVCECAPDEELHNLVTKHFSLESVGVAAERGPESEEDKRARRILEQTTKRVEKGFETGLLWRHDHVRFPNSLPMARRRFECFERRMKADPELAASVQQQIEEYVECGYIHEATEAELAEADPDKVWHVPLGAVRNPKKPKKIRMVWDASAKVGGISLNCMLLKGPDMLVPLLVVLCSFREFLIAVCGDIKQMFHQFKIRREDSHSQRFLYRRDPSQPVKVYVMDVGTFGATCSPSQAQYIKNLNAQEYAAEFPRAAKAIMERHYVDDYLDSFDTEEEAIKVALEVKEVHARGGFEIRNWHSNSKELLRRVGEPQQQVEAVRLDGESEAERVLGLLWLPREDVLQFSTSLQMEELTPTKRNILRCVMSLFDSQGLLSHITVQGRMIIQDTWRTPCGWDEEVSDPIQRRWRRWIMLFKEVGQMKIPRAYFPGFSAVEIGAVELHVFTDASEEAFGCTAFMRATINGKVHCSLVMGKAKVAPLKSLSVPRLELMAALLGARLAKTIRGCHSYPMTRCVFWTDSAVTLAWIQSEHRRYRQFVAFRVGEILSLTDPTQWRWVPTLHNVADEATKWGKGPSTNINSRWFKGPEFLYQPESEWPRRTSNEPIETEEEMRPCLVHCSQPVQMFDFERFSKWERLQRTVGWIHRYIENLRRRVQKKQAVSGCLKQSELAMAETSLWRAVQAAAYPKEVAALEQIPTKKQIDDSSRLYKLSPYLDERGVIRIDSRIGAAPYVTRDFKYPIILPRQHRATELLVDSYHRQYRHANSETVCNEIRQRFHISQLRPLIRQVSKRCQACKVSKAVPQIPRQAPLPEARLAATTRPFSYVGLDYFGPIQVKVGRSLVKRWVALFTCLTIRAVHLEVVHSLSTSSCKMAIRRFISRRGAPMEIYSDNGTNFQGASRELREQIAAMNKDLEATFTNCETKWIFNPPAAPHFGGSWERLVRSVKKAMASMSNWRNPDDETLATVVAEAESIVNSRPLTYMPLKHANEEALTPNHFLLLSSSGVKQPPRTIGETTKLARTDYDLARRMLDQFWRRWVREYLPTLTKRTKWFKEEKPVEVGDVVVIIDDGLRNGWTRGRIASVVPGRDGRIRRVIVQTADRKLHRRPVSKLAVLEVDQSGNAKVVPDRK